MAGNGHKAVFLFVEGSDAVIGNGVRIQRIGQKENDALCQPTGLQRTQTDGSGALAHEVLGQHVRQIGHALHKIHFRQVFKGKAVFFRPAAGVGAVVTAHVYAAGQDMGSGVIHVARHGQIHQRVVAGKHPSIKRHHVRSAQCPGNLKVRLAAVVMSHDHGIAIHQHILPLAVIGGLHRLSLQGDGFKIGAENLHPTLQCLFVGLLCFGGFGGKRHPFANQTGGQKPRHHAQAEQESGKGFQHPFHRSSSPGA